MLLDGYFLIGSPTCVLYRADIVRNFDAWYHAFGVTPDQKLYLAPEKRVRIW